VSNQALVVVDMLNAYEHDDAERLTRSVEHMLPALCRLIERAADRGVPTVYVNDNLGNWNEGREELVERVLDGKFAHLVEPIAPDKDTMFVVKARHSIFYETPMEYLLRSQDIGEIVLAGQVTEQCILYSALDAYIRHIDVTVPRDAVAHIHEDLAQAALRMMEINMRARIVDADDALS
jgi:nicotinamidase-related amidase